MSAEEASRFIHDERHLGQWLLQLVSKDSEARKAAAKVITDRFYMPGDLELLSAEQIDAAPQQFQEEVRNVLRGSDFPTATFVQDLLSLDILLQDLWCEKVKEDSGREKETNEAESKELGENPTDVEIKRFLKRQCIRLVRDCKRISEEEPHEVMTTGITISFVIDVLGSELLPAAALIRTMLRSEHKAYKAVEIIDRMGRDALAFYDDLVAGLEKHDPNYYCSRGLGALLKHASEKVPGILDLASNGDIQVRINAITALDYCGRPATASVPAVETRLGTMLENCTDEAESVALVSALGGVARTALTVSLLLRYLRDPEKRGTVIDALGRISREPQLVVLHLTELLDTFEEFDPDRMYHGEHERVVQALRGFGPAAVPAIPMLIRHVWTKPQQYYDKSSQIAERREPDEEVIRLLGELGSLAIEALPALREVRDAIRARAAEENGTENADSADGISETQSEPPDEDYLDTAIRKIERK